VSTQWVLEEVMGSSLAKWVIAAAVAANGLHGNVNTQGNANHDHGSTDNHRQRYSTHVRFSPGFKGQNSDLVQFT